MSRIWDSVSLLDFAYSQFSLSQWHRNPLCNKSLKVDGARRYDPPLCRIAKYIDCPAARPKSRSRRTTDPWLSSWNLISEKVISLMFRELIRVWRVDDTSNGARHESSVCRNRIFISIIRERIYIRVTNLNKQSRIVRIVVYSKIDRARSVVQLDTKQRNRVHVHPKCGLCIAIVS